jgi:lipoprotein NlpI
MNFLTADRCAIALVLAFALTSPAIRAAQADAPSAEALAQAAQAKRVSLTREIDRLTADIDAGRLQGKELAEAFRRRGIALSRLSQNGRAVEDFARAIELEQLTPEYYEDRAITYLKLREFARAQTDLSMALGLDSKRPTAHREEGRLASYRDEYARAARSFALAMENDEGMGAVYAGIWLHVAVMRGGLNMSSPLPSMAEALPAAVWPAPVIRMLTGAIRPEEAVAMAQSPDVETNQAQKCEAYFYAGQQYLLDQKPDAAKAAFEAAVATDMTEFLEYDWALRELELMKARR